MVTNGSLFSSFAEWLRDQGKSSGTCKTYVGVIEQFSQWLGNMELDEITREDVQKYIDFLEDTGKSPSTVEKHFMAVNVFSRYLGRPQIMLNINRKAKDKKVKTPEFLNESEERELLQKVKSEGNLRNIAIVYTLLHTGIRVSELCELKWTDIEISEQSGILQIRNYSGETERIVPLSNEVIYHLNSYMESLGKRYDALFISSVNEQITTRAVQYILKKFGVHPHKLRHTFCYKLIKNGIDINTVSKLAGHKDTNVTKRYMVDDGNQHLLHAIQKTFA
jgi:integrase/recombinase XerD